MDAIIVVFRTIPVQTSPAPLRRCLGAASPLHPPSLAPPAVAADLCECVIYRWLIQPDYRAVAEAAFHFRAANYV